MSEENKNDVFPVDEEDDDVMVTIILENNAEQDCEILTIFEAGEREYIVLRPVDSDGEYLDETTVYIYRYSGDEEGTPNIENIPDENEFEQASIRFDELQNEALSE